jgi:trehalose 6-phosphate synthase
VIEIGGRANYMAQQSGDQTSDVTGARDTKAATELAHRLNTGRKLVIASNRGPLYFAEDRSGQLSAKRDSSRSSEVFESLDETLISWISGAVSSADRKASESLASPDGELRSDVLPTDWDVRFVSPPRRVHHKFYNVICNPLLWFLLHRSWSPTFTPTIGDQEHDAWERGYRAVNDMFADEVVKAGGDDPIALVSRDYQLMLVPGMVRERSPEALIHHSFETPWPWPSDLEILPTSWRYEILSSLLSADVLSFPSKNDIIAFVTCVTENLGAEVGLTSDAGGSMLVASNGRTTRLTVAPAATRSERFNSVVEFDATKRFISDLSDDNYRHTFVTVDRAEPHKNIVRSINAFGDLLKKRPELVEDVRYLLFLTPGPTHISAYKRLSDEIRRAARRVNEKAPGKQPVKVVEENNFYRAVAALSIYDTLISVPVVDGSGRSAIDGSLLNTVDGGMILSETNVAVNVIGQSVAQVGFADTQSLTAAMSAAIDESGESRRQKADTMRSAIQGIAFDRTVEQILEELLKSDRT